MRDTRQAMPAALAEEEFRALLQEEYVQSGVVYNPRSRDLHVNPYPLLHEIRSKDPVHWSPLLNAWLITRHRDANAFLRSPALSKDLRNASVNRLGSAGLMSPAPGLPTMLRLDPPDHTRLRSLVAKAFTPKAVDALKPRIEALTDGLLCEMKKGESFDLMRDFANPLPVMVIAELLGVSAEDKERFKEWSTDFALGNDVASSEAMRIRRDTAKEKLLAYFKRVLQERRRDPVDDLLSGLVQVEERGDRLTEEELLGTCILLLVAGSETTTNLIGNGMLGLLQNPEQLQLLRQEPALISQAVEELLRYDSPVQAVQRVVTEDMEIGEKHIDPGAMVITLIGAVNRDPEAFPDPDLLDITRRDVHHVSFGYGIHYCLGAPLARAISCIALPALMNRFPGLRLPSTMPTWRESSIFRGLVELQLFS